MIFESKKKKTEKNNRKMICGERSGFRILVLLFFFSLMFHLKMRNFKNICTKKILCLFLRILYFYLYVEAIKNQAVSYKDLIDKKDNISN